MINLIFKTFILYTNIYFVVLQLFQFSSVQSLSLAWLFVTPWAAAHQASLFITNSWSLLKFMSVESVMPSNHPTLCHPHHLPPSIFPNIRVFSNESVIHIRWPKYWSFSFSINPSNEYSGLISFRMDWLGSCVQLFVIPWIAAQKASLSFTISWSLLKFMSIESIILSNHLIFCRPLLLLPSIFPSIRVFSNESALCTRWPNHWSFIFSISPSSEHTSLISFRIDWFDFLAVQGTLKSLLQHHSLKASILQCSAFFMVQLSHPYMTTGQTIAFTIQTFVGKVMSLLFNMFSTFIIAFLPRSKHLLVLAIVTICSDFGNQEKKSPSLFPLFPQIFAMKW